MKVFITASNQSMEAMFTSRGWEITDSIAEADIIQFTGGADVGPHLYGEATHPMTRPHARRDEEDKRVYQIGNQIGKPMVGICRGGQFLNVMCGGRMWQHVDKHAIPGTHLACNVERESYLPVTSTHHQMMRAGEHAKVLLVASESTYRERMPQDVLAPTRRPSERGEDIEALWYPRNKVLCFQPHPEYMDKDTPCQNLYFEYIEEKLLCVDM